MDIYYIRANGETLHNNPLTNLYIKGEPPANYPNRKFNYQKQCLVDGYARVGHPGTGDLRDPFWRARAAEKYSLLEHHPHFRRLDAFRMIRTGDYILLPAGKRYEAYVGKVIKRDVLSRKSIPHETGDLAYYYYFDISKSHWYENAHRVDVEWLRKPDGTYNTVFVPEMGGTWRRGFWKLEAIKASVMVKLLNN